MAGSLKVCLLLVGYNSHTVVRHLNTCYLALKWIRIVIEPYHPYWIILLFGEGAIYEKAPHFREGLSGGADGARTHDLGRDRPAF